MITWMQKHRKYLVITIWISTIAFVGAGFVGWGSYDFGSMGGKVAKVGKIEITKEDLSSTYGNIYNYYSKMTGGKLDEQTAKTLKLESLAVQTLINQALLQNFANELEITVSDEEVAAKIASMEPFQKNGHFDKESYIMALKNVGIKP
ncbi:MAG TPA: SurA N-terminal domain-containing protein, partial [Campylobacterales bacterium]|nr:SurA N-terminal domain-containing protein [Campylobacterales bacterium]